MHVITLNESDMSILQTRFQHLEGSISKYYGSLDSLAEYFTKHYETYYKISDFLGIAYGFIDGKRTLFMYGNGYALEGVFGSKRVYG